MDDRKAIINLIKKEENFYLISHMMPDGDSIGSLLAMGEGLAKIGKKVKLFTPGPVPQKYNFLKGSELIGHEVFSKNTKVTVIVLDSSDIDRLGLFKDAVLSGRQVINIDHHVTNQRFGTLNLIESAAAATGEIVYKILQDLQVEICAHIAEALYVAIATDTGSFKYENTTANTHRVAATLLECGLNPGALSQLIFDERPLSFFLLLKEAISSLEMYEHRRIAIMTLSRDVVERSGATTDDLDGIVNYSRNIEGIDLGILFYIENNDEVKVGFRSKEIDVSILAGKLNGGGHARAAGCRLKGNYEDIKKLVMEEALSMIDKYVN